MATIEHRFCDTCDHNVLAHRPNADESEAVGPCEVSSCECEAVIVG